MTWRIYFLDSEHNEYLKVMYSHVYYVNISENVREIFGGYDMPAED